MEEQRLFKSYDSLSLEQEHGGAAADGCGTGERAGGGRAMNKWKKGI